MSDVARVTYTPQRIVSLTEIPEEKIMKDLERYKRLALELGVTAVETVKVDEYILPFIDERVRFKCLIPKCGNWGTNPNCPPRAPPVDEIRKLLSRYRWALVTKIDARPPEDFAGRRTVVDMRFISWYARLNEITHRVETTAWNDGYYLALSLTAGSCREYLCHGRKCTAIDPGGECRYPLRARPSLEAYAIDCFGLAAKLGWEVYPIGVLTDPAKVPCAVCMAVTFII
jgi:predicted metal-binding protein